MRLDKYLSTVTELSRSQAKKMIKAGRIRALGKTSLDPRMTIPACAPVELDGRLLRTATSRYFIMNKPAGYVCANTDKQHITVIDLLEEDNVERLHIAGRLDIDTTGLLLISDDGPWMHRITAPASHCKKTYRVETARAIDPSVIALFQQGIKLEQEKHVTRPANLRLIDTHIAELTISEGKYHQIKRMFAAIGNHVKKLHRQQVGDIFLEPTLEPGQYRALTAEEIASV